MTAICGGVTTHYLSAPCSAGKTYSLSGLLARRLTKGSESKSPLKIIDVDVTQSYCCAFTTLEMVEQFERDLVALGLEDVTDVITSRTCPGRTVPELLQTLSTCGGRGRIVLCTHESMFRLPYRQSTGWMFIFDEMPPVNFDASILVSRSKSPLGEWLTIEGNGPYLRNPVPRGHSFHGKADRIPVIADSR